MILERWLRVDDSELSRDTVHLTSVKRSVKRSSKGLANQCD